MAERAHVVESGLRTTDLLASKGPNDFLILLPQTDSLGAGILAQRIGMAINASADGKRRAAAGSPALVAASTFPVDGTQRESMTRTLTTRLSDMRESVLVTQPGLLALQPMDALLDRMLELGSVEPADVEGQILRFVLEDVARRPAERGVLFVSPGARWLPEVLETLHDIQGRSLRTEIVVVADAEEQDSDANLIWATKSSLDASRPFLVYFGEGPAYALIGQITMAAERTPIFQTSDRALVQHLAFELQQELGIKLSV